MDERDPGETRRKGEQRLQAFLGDITPGKRAEAEELPKRIRLMNARAVVKVRRVHAVADSLYAPAAGYAACARGCSHCCHGPVVITKADAVSIGEHLGVKPADLKTSSRRNTGLFSYATPCPFLRDNECSIYQRRPMACRTHFNFDDDNYWCRHENWRKTGAVIPKPRIEPLHTAYTIASVEGEAELVTADIRDFFPVAAPGPAGE